MNKELFIKKHPRIDYWQRCLRYQKDKTFFEIVRSIYRDPNLLYFEQYGNNFSEYNFYDVYLHCPSKGFFALFNQTLDALRYAQTFSLTPVVTWSDSCLYKESEPINGSSNPFCYYFEQPAGFERSDLREARRVLKYNEGQRAFSKTQQFTVAAKTIVEGNIYNQYIEDNGKVYKKYIKIKPEIQIWVDDIKERMNFNGKVLGVHVRCTDFYKGYVNHPVAATITDYLAATEEAVEKHLFDKIFVATDEADVIDVFKEKFGEKIITCPGVFRSMDGTAIHFSQEKRKNHKYLLGLEVLCDMLLLSECDGLIGGYSNVCISAQIVKKSKGIEYDYLHIIDKGFNQSGKTTYQDHKMSERIYKKGSL